MCLFRMIINCTFISLINRLFVHLYGGSNGANRINNLDMNNEIAIQHQLLELGLIDREQFDLNIYYITSLSDNRINTANQH